MNANPHTPIDEGEHQHRHGSHGLMMIACCIPMLIIAGLLVATGVVNPGFLLFAVACTAMMVMMMRAMPGDKGHGGHGRR
jgi:hypothetical protein